MGDSRQMRNPRGRRPAGGGALGMSGRSQFSSLLFLTAAFLILGTLMPPGISAQDGTAGGGTGKPWKVGMVEWQTPGIEAEDQIHVRSLALQVYSRISRWTEHPLSPGERALLEKRKARQARLEREKEILKLKERRDELALKKPGSEDLREAERELRKKKGEDQDTGELETEEIPEKAVLDYRVFRENRPLYPAGAPGAAGNDWVFSGRVEPVAGGYYAYQLHLRTFLEEEPRVLWEDVASPEDLPELVDRASAAAARAIRGKPLGRISLSAQPEDAKIFIDGRLRGIGALRKELVEAGTHSLRVEAAGFRGEYFHAELMPRQELVLQVELLPGEENRVEIITEPAGAQVYQGGVWVGESPLVLRRAGEGEQLVRIEKEGYYPVNPEFPPGDAAGDGGGRIDLLPQEQPPEDLFKEKEDIFYRDLGLFMVSLAFPVVFSGVSHNYEALYTDRPLEKYRQRGLFFYYSYGASLSFSGILLVNAYQSLRDYIKTAEDYVQ